MNAEARAAPIAKRPAREILSLRKMGAAFPSRISFMRNLIRKIHQQKWQLERRAFKLDANGFGHAIYTAHAGARPYSLLVFTHALAPEKRTDRVIAEAWDATFNLFDGIPTEADIRRLSQNTPLQEAGRFTSKELALGRANKSLRMFNVILDCLQKGQQPDIDQVAEVGYLMRTSAVYGSGKFGCADRMAIEARPELRPAFHMEMLAVYLFRSFTLDLIDHIAKSRAPETAAPLDNDIKRFLGVGNSTGLGMAPFLLKHSTLMHRWVDLREEALRRSRSRRINATAARAELSPLLSKALTHLNEWNVADETQTEAILDLRRDMQSFMQWLAARDQGGQGSDQFWNDVYEYAERHLGMEALSFIESLIIECNGALVDELGDRMFEEQGQAFDPTMSVGEVKRLIRKNYDWVNEIDFGQDHNGAMFWYYSEEKMEPRLGERQTVPGAELEMPLAIARDIKRLAATLAPVDDAITVADFLLDHAEYRHLIRRIQTIDACPYGEVYDNLISETARPIDLLRFKLAFFGACKFDPKSSLWTRINMYQGAPLFDEILDRDPDGWALPVKPERRAL